MKGDVTRRLAAAILGAALLPAVGCGTGEYEQRMSATLAVLKTSAATKVPLAQFDEYQKQNALLGGQVNLRVPNVFDTVLVESSLNPNASPPITPATLYPAGVKLPGYGRTWRAAIAASDGTRWPYYLHFAASRSPNVTLEQFTAELQQQFKATIPQTPARWEDVVLTAPDAARLDAKKLRIEGQLAFLDPRVGSEQPFAGVIELYAFAAGDYRIIVSSQCMKNFEAHTNISALLEVAASTLQIGNKSPAEL